MIKEKVMLIPHNKAGVWVAGNHWTYRNYTVEKGFITDLDSVARIPFMHALLKGRTVYGALLHDYLYSTGQVSREVADALFYDCMRDEGVPAGYANIMHLGVRYFGESRFLADQQKHTSKVNEGLIYLDNAF